MERTLPVNFDESCNPDLLSEISYGEHGAAPMMENVNSGRSSPIRGRTMKEYEQQIGSLKKENFNLKLRIYFLDERNKNKYSNEDIIKTNVELQVQCMQYKEDLEKKSELLNQASAAIKSLSSETNENIEKQLQQVKEECENKLAVERQRADDLNAELKDSLEKIRDLEELKGEIEDKNREIEQQSQAIKQIQNEFAEYKLDADKEKMLLKDELDGMSQNVSRKDRDIKRLSIIVEDKQMVDEGLDPLERSKLKDAADDAQNAVVKLRQQLADKDGKLMDKDEMIFKLEDLLRDKEKELGDAKTELEKLKKYYTKARAGCKDLWLKLEDEERKAKGLEEQLSALEEELEKAKQELATANLERQKASEKILELEKNEEGLMRAHGKKEAELEQFRDLLEKAQRSLCKSEDAVEALQRQLEEERKMWKEKLLSNETPSESSSTSSTITSTSFEKTADSHQHFHINIHSSMDGSPTKSDGPIQDVGELYRQIAHLEGENKRLQDLVHATEQTAHCQTQKMKKYRQMLVDQGLLPAGVHHASREHLADDIGGEPAKDGRRSRGRSVDSAGPIGPRRRSMSPLPFYKGTDLTDTDKLRQENERLQEQNNEYKNMLKIFQTTRSESPGSSLSGQDGGSADRLEVKIVMKWLDQLDQFLMKIREMDLNTSLPSMPQSPRKSEVCHLQKGLLQARDTLKSLSIAEANNEGRESPDSGCSDNNPASLQNNSLPLDSPSSQKSSPRIAKPDSQTDKFTSISTLTGTHPRGESTMSTECMRCGGNSAVSLGFSQLGNMDMTDVFRQDRSPESCEDSVFYRTLSQTRIADMTLLHDPDVSRNLHTTMSEHLLDITSLAKTDGESHVETLKRIIQSFERWSSKKTLGSDSYSEHIKELQRLRIELEKQLQIIEMLQEKVNEMGLISEEQLREKERMISDLREELGDRQLVIKDQIRAITDLKTEVHVKTERTVVAEKEMGSLRSKICHLENQHHLDRKYEHLLTESRSQMEKLAIETEEMTQELKNTFNDLNRAHGEVETCKETIDDLTKQLMDKQVEIKVLEHRVRKKDESLECQEKISETRIEELAAKNREILVLQEKNSESRLEELVMKNQELSRQMEEQRLNCSDYRKQIEMQNARVREMKERVDHLSKELSDTNGNRMSLQKQISIDKNKLRDYEEKLEKVKYNFNMMKTEYKRQKYHLVEGQRKLKEESEKTSTLELALKASEKMISSHELTDDEKERYISELLQLTKDLRRKLSNVIDQNKILMQQMTSMTEKSSEGPDVEESRTDDTKDVNVRTNVTVNLSLADTSLQMSNANSTWPTLSGMNSDFMRTDNLSSSLPIREKTLGGPALVDSFVNKNSRTSSYNGSGSIHNKSSARSSLMSNGVEMSPGVLSSAGGSGHFSVPGPIYKQQMTDKCLLYHVGDSPRQLAKMTNFQIDSDLRSLFAIGMIDHFEKLKKETHECQSILKGMNARLSERLEHFARRPASESVEYGTLKELGFSVDEMRLCVDGQLSMIAGFWTSELPAPNEKGEFVNQKLLDENAMLEDQVANMRMKCQSMSSSGLNEEVLCESLMSTLQVVTKARQNLEQKHN